jgi:DNA-directed RNA polymerase subunit RPC12/RpoP
MITIRADEMWCMRCGAEGAIYAGDSRTTPGQKCVKCGSRKIVPAVTVLRTGEYVLI